MVFKGNRLSWDTSFSHESETVRTKQWLIFGQLITSFFTEEAWETSMIKVDDDPEVVLSFLNFKTKTQYQFRVMAYNSASGISVPSEPSEFIETPGKNFWCA
jgi:hypothetical protein